MEEITSIVFSWQFLLMGVIVALVVSGSFWLGRKLWALGWKWLRGVIRFFDAAAPWVPILFGAGLGAIPVWPRPSAMASLPEGQQYVAMIVLGILAGVFYERIWKGVKQVIEARGIKLDIDLHPKEQKKVLDR